MVGKKKKGKPRGERQAVDSSAAAKESKRKKKRFHPSPSFSPTPLLPDLPPRALASAERSRSDRAGELKKKARQEKESAGAVFSKKNQSRGKKEKTSRRKATPWSVSIDGNQKKKINSRFPFPTHLLRQLPHCSAKEGDGRHVPDREAGPPRGARQGGHGVFFFSIAGWYASIEAGAHATGKRRDLLD